MAMSPSRRPLGSGDLTELITFEVEIERDDDIGGRTKRWMAHGQAWAKIVAARARQDAESIEGGAERSVVKYRVNIYRDPTITPSMRIRWGSVLMNIRSVPQVPSHSIFMEIEAEAGVFGTA